MRVTVLSKEKSARDQVLNDFKTHPKLIPWQTKVVLQDYGPEDWKWPTFQVENFAVVCQKPNGQVLARQNDYDDGPDGLAKNIEAADRIYRPEKDTDARKPQLPSIDLSKIPSWLWAALGGLGLGWLFTRKR
jgi:hypothetical protein